jgi:hypothetical protein
VSLGHDHWRAILVHADLKLDDLACVLSKAIEVAVAEGDVGYIWAWAARPDSPARKSPKIPGRAGPGFPIGPGSGLGNEPEWKIGPGSGLENQPESSPARSDNLGSETATSRNRTNKISAPPLLTPPRSFTSSPSRISHQPLSWRRHTSWQAAAFALERGDAPINCLVENCVVLSGRRPSSSRYVLLELNLNRPIA